MEIGAQHSGFGVEVQVAVDRQWPSVESRQGWLGRDYVIFCLDGGGGDYCRFLIKNKMTSFVDGP